AGYPVQRGVSAQRERHGLSPRRKADRPIKREFGLDSCGPMAVWQVGDTPPDIALAQHLFGRPPQSLPIGEAESLRNPIMRHLRSSSLRAYTTKVYSQQLPGSP